MFDRLRKLFTGKEEGVEPSAAKHSRLAGEQDAAFHQLNSLAPLSGLVPDKLEDSKPAGKEPPKSFVCREAVLNHEQRVAGYEFRLNKSKRNRIRHSADTIHRLYDEVLIRNVLRMNIDRLLGHRIAFIPVSMYSLGNLLIEQLPAHNTVLVLECSEEMTADLCKDAHIFLPRLQELQRLGFRIGLSNYSERAEMQPFLDLAEYVLIDVSDRPLPDITTEVNAISRNAFSKKLVAQDIDSLEMLQVCKKLPFAFFQGAFVTRREKWEKPRTDTGRLKVLEIMNQVRRNAEIPEIAALFRQDPVLSYKILRYINSPAGGLLNPASTLEQALLILGRQQLYRWLTLLLFVSGNVEELDAALMENALVRARLTELLGAEKVGASNKDDLFVTGMFSLLDVLLRTPMEQALENLKLPEAVTQALIAHEGPYSPYLELAIACEEFDAKKIAHISRLLDLDVDRVNINHIEALVWAQNLDSGPG